MDEASGAPRSSLTSPSAVPASRPSLQRSPLQQTWLQLTAAVAVAILLLLLAFVVWPVLRVLATSLAGPEGLTLAHYAEFFSSWRLVRILVQSLDRKSTRLNSSHGYISYAVFCLKKKK